MSKELHRVEDIIIDGVYRTPCLKCGKVLELWFNGGELDYKECCGLTYMLQHGRFDFVILEGGPYDNE